MCVKSLKMSQAFTLLCLCVSLTVSCATYPTVYAPDTANLLSRSPAFSSSSSSSFSGPGLKRPAYAPSSSGVGAFSSTGLRGGSQGFSNAGGASGGGGDLCANINPAGIVRPPPKTPSPSSARKTVRDVNFAMPTRQLFHDQFSNVDFFFDVARKPEGAMGVSALAGGLRQDVTVNDLPALFNQRVSLALFTIEPCGINLPHTHPRATEMLFAVDAAKLQVAFVEENGGRTVVNEISSGQMTFFPQGLLHYELNLDCRPAKFVAILNHEDPGVVTASTRLFDIPPVALDTTLAIDRDLAQLIRNGLSESPAGGRAECLSRCGIAPPPPTANSTVNFFTRSNA